MALRRDAFMRVGGFDERFFLYFEDIDLCLRLREQVGEVVYEPSILVHHVRGAAAATDRASARLHYRRSQALFWSLHGKGRLSAGLMQWYARVRLAHKP